MGKRHVAKQQETACLEGIGEGPGTICAGEAGRQKRSKVDKAQGFLSHPLPDRYRRGMYAVDQRT
jgi:hypothetical protein